MSASNVESVLASVLSVAAQKIDVQVLASGQVSGRYSFRVQFVGSSTELSDIENNLKDPTVQASVGSGIANTLAVQTGVITTFENFGGISKSFSTRFF